MAKVGMAYIVVAALKDQTPTYEKGQYLGASSKITGTPTASNVKDYGDDNVTETDTSVTGGTLNIELNEKTDDIYAFVLGHAKDTISGEVISNAEDIAPFLGVGVVGKSKRSNKLKFTAKWYYKVQLKEPADEDSTKQENTAFAHTTLEGDMYKLDNGDWKAQKEFDTLTEAKTWLNTKAGIVVAGGSGTSTSGGSGTSTSGGTGTGA
jgi:phi13 family phage major tail protein